MSRITFVLRNPSFFRFVEGVIRCLLERGHTLTLISPRKSSSQDSPFDIEEKVRLINEHMGGKAKAANLLFLPLLRDQRKMTAWLTVARLLRSYAYRMSGEYQWSDYQRERWITFLPSHIQRVIHWVGRNRVEALLRLRIARAALARAERFAQPRSDVVFQLRELNPDVVIATPVIYPFYSGEVDYLKAARILGRATSVLVGSWDHLTARGVFPLVPELILVWSEAQIEEAIHIHGLSKEKVVAVGAPVFDEWFSHQYRLSREVFCERAGLDPAQPYIVYAGSSPVVGDESAIMTRLARELCASDLRAKVLVRPHPNQRQSLARLNSPELHVWPPVGSFPLTTDQKQDYYNTLYHSAAVVGLNTTVFLEAMILDKPCISIAPQVAARAPFKHYEHLVNSDCCEFVADEAAAAAMVMNVLRDRDTKREARRRFIKKFIRPGGLDQTSAEVAVKAIESLCSSKGCCAA